MMLSSFGFDKGVARTAVRNNSSKYVLEVPRGFSVHVHKNLPPPQTTVFPSTGKLDYTQNRDVVGSHWIKQQSYPPRPEAERKSASIPVETRSSQLSAYARVFEPKRSKQQRPYGIYPTAIPDTYIYERSVSSASDILSSDSSSTSSDSDINAESLAEFSVEISSTRASSSTETLETTALDWHPHVSTAAPPTGPLRSSPPTAPTPTAVRARTISQSASASYPPIQPRRVSVEEAFDSDSETVISEGAEDANHATSRTQTSTSIHAGPSRGLGTSLPLSTPIRRNSTEGSPTSTHPGAASRDAVVPQNPSRPAGSSSPPYDEALLRAPPGLQAASSSRPTPSRSSSGNSSKSQTSPDPARVAQSSDPVSGTSPKRCVRWTENLVCPSPVPVIARRRGWYNRRGDQLWTNDGKFRSPEPGQEYPADLSTYPEPNAGWMNEEGVRIDMQHRLIPKPPLRSALKQPRTQPLPSHDPIQVQ